jgi:uncharacterized protein YdeI (YjbR/CyaY-like superfamily)
MQTFDVKFFSKHEEFRVWLEKNHKLKTGLLVGFYKIESGKQGMTWSQSVDEALCFGWIDGIRRSIDKDSYCIRFTPRKSSSTWSALNIKKVENLMKQGLMKDAGIEAFSKRKAEKSKIYSFESDIKKLSDDFENVFKTNEKAWKFFTAQSLSYKKTVIHWIMTARQEMTRLSRLEKAIAESEKQERLWNKYK